MSRISTLPGAFGALGSHVLLVRGGRQDCDADRGRLLRGARCWPRAPSRAPPKRSNRAGTKGGAAALAPPLSRRAPNERAERMQGSELGARLAPCRPPRQSNKFELRYERRRCRRDGQPPAVLPACHCGRTQPMPSPPIRGSPSSAVLARGAHAACAARGAKFLHAQPVCLARVTRMPLRDVVSPRRATVRACGADQTQGGVRVAWLPLTACLLFASCLCGFLL